MVAINQEGIFTFINDAFVQAYGWTADDLLGQLVVVIMPKYMRDGHNVGFSRFLTTESSTILGKTLPLQILHKDGREVLADHYIVGDKKDDRWRFAAIIDKPKSHGR